MVGAVKGERSGQPGDGILKKSQTTFTNTSEGGLRKRSKCDPRVFGPSHWKGRAISMGTRMGLKRFQAGEGSSASLC